MCRWIPVVAREVLVVELPPTNGPARAAGRDFGRSCSGISEREMEYAEHRAVDEASNGQRGQSPAT